VPSEIELSRPFREPSPVFAGSSSCHGVVGLAETGRSKHRKVRVLSLAAGVPLAVARASGVGKQDMGFASPDRVQHASATNRELPVIKAVPKVWFPRAISSPLEVRITCFRGKAGEIVPGIPESLVAGTYSYLRP